jgi:hypothetical protein
VNGRKPGMHLEVRRAGDSTRSSNEHVSPKAPARRARDLKRRNFSVSGLSADPRAAVKFPAEIDGKLRNETFGSLGHRISGYGLETEIPARSADARQALF